MDAIAMAAGPSMDMFGKGGDEFNSVINGDIGKHGVHIMEGFDEAFPMVPIVPPFCVRCRHDASINASPFSAEKMREAILVLRWRPCHEQFVKGRRNQT